MGRIVFYYIKKSIFLGALLFAVSPAYASVPPNSGTALEGVKPPAIQQPVQKVPSIAVEDRELPISVDGQQKILVKGFRFVGEPTLPEGELLSLIQNEAGKEITLSDINTLAARITKYLHKQGYFVAVAFIPAQDIKDGIVEISVIPGKYGQVKVTGNGHVDPDSLKDMLFCARPGMIITRGPLERALLLISDFSGISVNATLTAGETAGTADLILETADTVKISGGVYADNWGNRYTGRTRYGTLITVNNFSNNGDTFSLGGLTTGQGINNYNFSYSDPLGHDGAKVEVQYSHVGYRLGEDFADAGATGRAAVTSYDVSYPFIRSRSFSLYGILGYDIKHLRDDIAGYGSYSPRTSKLWNLGMAGNFADTWLGGGTNAFSLTHYWGKLNFNNAAALTGDASNAQTNGDFSKTVLTYQRQQYVAANLSFNVNFTGQLADKNLDSSEKLYLGGADGIRAFPQGEASGDQGYKVTGEIRWRLPYLSAGKNSVYLNGFYDYGSVIVDKNPYSSDDNRRSLMGAGLGLLWTKGNDYTIRLDYAWKLGKEQATADDDKNGHLWLQGVKYF
ncbi:Heme/hemopexin transporter protein HuxB [Sporomusa silvacetica DSM 10669]|uniref:Heme/hemopexin transporter protein HuxB n=1 Tax=Sporomusa silvacetica DSM 10669 TaxID=1123289 RepID=A0ABZ3IT77_9FIRM|nr:ShlB/FhaC/HecB family hemolysin secretion/activation protein [Sporomusa silvacetica]OZC19780.1 heme/hemopexin transporter protein HuxB precursor [Sporomusa silvacetica DSM 10669]